MDSYFGSNTTYCRAGTMSAYIYNITSPYTDNTNRASIVGTTVAMFTLTVLFFNLTMFRHLSSAVRLVRCTALALFLPIMSYLFSEAKNAGGADANTAAAAISPPELPVRARLILTWMLLVELLRKKVESMWVPEAGTMAGYSTMAVHAAQIVWLGSLVFCSIQDAGRRAAFGIFWAVAAAKMVQRLVVTQVISRSFAAGRNPDIIGAYTQLVLERRRRRRRGEHWGNGNDRRRRLQRSTCEFAVKGEEKIKRKTGPLGYVVIVTGTDDDTNVVGGGGVTTVATVYREVDTSLGLRSARRLCVSLALFKLLRRRLEDPRARAAYDEMEIAACKDLILGEVEVEGQGDEGDEEEVYRVVADEVTFLSEYYYSSAPVVLASPFFFLVHYILFPAMVACLCFTTVVASGYGDVAWTLRRVREDNSVLTLRKAVCLLQKVTFSPPALLATVDLCITLFLFAAFVYEEVCEVGVFLLSNWFVVSLVCTRARLRQTTQSPSPRRRQYYCYCVIASVIRCLQFLGKKLRVRRRPLPLMQHDMTRMAMAFHGVGVTPQAVVAPTEVKVSVVKHLKQLLVRSGGSGSDSEATFTLDDDDRFAFAGPEYAPSACVRRQGIVRVILTWHVATAIFETTKAVAVEEGAAAGHRRTATVLSRYCAYLVAFRPELLPEDRNETQHLYKAAVKGLKEALGGCWGYYVNVMGMRERGRLDRLLKIADDADGGLCGTGSVVRHGAILGKKLIGELDVEGRSSKEEELWEVLAQLWTQLVVYLAPATATDAALLRGHYAALVEGGEFLTILWALATHTGLTRPANVFTETGSARY